MCRCARSTCLLPCVSTPRPAISMPSMHPSRRDRPPSPRMERRGEGPPNRWGDALECASAERGNGLVRTLEAPLRRLRRPGPTPHAAGEIPSRAGRPAWAAHGSHQCCVTASLVAAHQVDDSSARVHPHARRGRSPRRRRMCVPRRSVWRARFAMRTKSHSIYMVGISSDDGEEWNSSTSSCATIPLSIYFGNPNRRPTRQARGAAGEPMRNGREVY